MKRLLPVFLFAFLFLGGIAQAAESGSVVLKALLVNPSETESQKVPVELALPREATKKHVLEVAEGLEIRYDSEQGLYKAMGEVTLLPGEQRMIQVRIADIWQVPEKDLQFQQGYIKELMKVLADGRYADTSKKLEESIQERLERIQKSQREPVAASKHIAIYRENLTLFDDIKKDVRFLEKVSADKMPFPAALLEVEGGKQGKGTPAESLKTITLKMMVRNPSQTEKALLPVDYYLPPEVKEKDIVNAGELEARFDVNRGAVFLHKEEVALEAGESKTFEIVIRDIWHIEPETVKELQVDAVGMAQGFEGTKFEPAAERMKNEVIKKADDIIETQTTAEGKPVEDHIAVFVENLSLLTEMKDKVTKMARLEAAKTINPNVTPQSLGLETVKEPTEEESPEVPPEIIARAMFKDKSPDKKTFWKVIFAIVGFLGFVSLLFYILWWTQAKLERNLAKEEIL